MKAVTTNKDNMFQMCFVDPNQACLRAVHGQQGPAPGRSSEERRRKNSRASTIPSSPRSERGIEAVSAILSLRTATTRTSPTDAQKNERELVFLPMYYQHASLILAQAAVKHARGWFGVDGMDGILIDGGASTRNVRGSAPGPFNADSKTSARQSSWRSIRSVARTC